MSGTIADTGNEDFVPAYVGLSADGLLKERVKTAFQHLKDCDLCARY